MKQMKPPKPIALIILDGWGERKAQSANAIAMAKTPIWDSLLQTYPHTTLSACGLDVGLPEGQMGNSEVGHLTMGAGRVVYQDLTRISKSIETGAFKQIPLLIKTFQTARDHNQTVHLLGLLSPGGIHSHEAHLYAMIQLAVEIGVKKIVIHAFLDGRDMPPRSAKASIQALEDLISKTLSQGEGINIRIGSISGRFYAMDRDKRWDRTQAVYTLLTEGKGERAASAFEALEASYARGEFDEFVRPTLIDPDALIKDNDVVIFMNFRADRARQLSYALTDPLFSGFKRIVFPKLSAFLTLTQYASDLAVEVIFPPDSLLNMLGEYLQNHHYKQLRIAETEKYAHVTYFFNGGRESSFQNEDRILIPSPKVAHYDECPEMSADFITKQLVSLIQEQRYDVIVCNYANADMVGHTGNVKATVQAIETLDRCLGAVIAALKKVGGEALITADHGNAEIMFDEKTQQPHTAHTLERVPFVYVGRPFFITHENGNLSDIAPTLLTLMGLTPPPEMTGTPLV